MKILFSVLCVLCITLLFGSPVFGLTLAWDTYTDIRANILQIFSSNDGSTFTVLVDSIPTNMDAAEIPNGPDDTRVYYYLKAVDTDADPDVPSDPSNTVSFYWTTGGGGTTGPAIPGNIRLIDCDDPDLSDVDICNNRHQP